MQILSKNRRMLIIIERGFFVDFCDAPWCGLKWRECLAFPCPLAQGGRPKKASIRLRRLTCKGGFELKTPSCLVCARKNTTLIHTRRSRALKDKVSRYFKQTSKI